MIWYQPRNVPQSGPIRVPKEKRTVQEPCAHTCCQTLLVFLPLITLPLERDSLEPGACSSRLVYTFDFGDCEFHC